MNAKQIGIPEISYARLEAEKIFLGGLLVSGSDGSNPLEDVGETITPDDFMDSGYPDNTHERIYLAMMRAKKTDQLSVARQLNKDGELRKGDIAYLSSLIANCEGIDCINYAYALREFIDHPQEEHPGTILDEHSFGLTDLGNAERLVKYYGDKLRYCYERKRWLVWTGQVWEWDSGAKITALAKLTVRNIYHEAGDEPDEKKRKELADHARRSESDQRLNAMINLAKSETRIPVKVTELDTNPWLFNCLNGTINLQTGQLLPHRKEDLLTVIVPTEYHPNAQCPYWLSFLDKVTNGDTDLMAYLQRAVGYSLTGDIRSQVIFLLYGLGNNGKSTFTMTIRRLMSGYGERLDADDLMVKDRKLGGGPKEGIANLRNKRYVVGSEIQDGRRLDVSLVKDMTGGETLKGRRLYEHEVEFMPSHKLWLYGNHKPMIADSTLSIWRRVKQIPFDVTIPEEEQIEGYVDTYLQPELPGILAWSVKGCLDWQQCGLKEPEAVTTATASYRHEQDILGDFLEDCCILEPRATMPKADLKEIYQEWCQDNSVEPDTQRKFRAKLIEKGIIDHKGTGGQRCWKGIRIKTEQDLVAKSGKTNDSASVSGKKWQVLHKSPFIEEKQKNFIADSATDATNATNSDLPDYPDDIPPSYPTQPCPTCNCRNYWLTNDNRWLCSSCHPKPGGSD